MTHRVRIVSQKSRDGKTVEITTLDPKTGRVVSKYTAPAKNAEADLRAKQDIYSRRGYRADVVEG